MNSNIKPIAYSAWVVAVLVGGLGALIPSSASYWQGLVASVATTFLGLGLAIVVVNHVLTSADKKLAARPLLKMIRPHVENLHNALYIGHLHNELGKEEFQKTVGIYQRHRSDPKAFSPSDRDRLCAVILKKCDELNEVYAILGEQFKEVTLLLGWSFDAEITEAAHSARLSYATFKANAALSSDDAKLAVIEAYFDAEACTTTVFGLLSKHIGLKTDDWQEAC